MTQLVTKSFDNLGEPKTSVAVSDNLTTYGGANRDAVVQFNQLLTFLGNSVKGNPAFAISTNFDVKNANAVTYALSGVLATLSANTNFDTGTTAVITADKWGIAILTYDGTTATVTWSSATPAYGTEALAIAALGTLATLVPASGFASLGYITVLTGSAVTWTAGTDALAGGTGGTPATTTNYYNDPTLAGTFGPQQIGDMNGTVITT